ncbi:hypothetical protein LOAG_09738 [Loa loa]|uniref:Uncharacterized protein n=1 Tax=Loa loa TaxID=7209 RepID=A0A1S0TR35_LOALO|nr:hypothetical protein LOAG_09738 [Loa loa]EFO18757.1 hypothetical protein LOAG_09738 [Loa loa]
MPEFAYWNFLKRCIYEFSATISCHTFPYHLLFVILLIRNLTGKSKLSTRTVILSKICNRVEVFFIKHLLNSHFQKQYRQYRRDEERYIAKRDRVLKDRLDRANGSNEAKNYLYELLNLQSNMNITLKVYETTEEEMRHSILATILQEATDIWNLLDPAHID